MTFTLKNIWHLRNNVYIGKQLRNKIFYSFWNFHSHFKLFWVVPIKFSTMPGAKYFLFFISAFILVFPNVCSVKMQTTKTIHKPTNYTARFQTWKVSDKCLKNRSLLNFGNLFKEILQESLWKLYSRKRCISKLQIQLDQHRKAQQAFASNLQARNFLAIWPQFWWN